MSGLRGCPIPPVGIVHTYAICLPNTWEGLVEDLLLPPTDPGYWEVAATDAEKDSATQTAQAILHDFLSDACVCGSCPPLGAWHEESLDFANDPYGWYVTDPDIMEWQSGVGFVALPVTGLFTGKRLTIRREIDPPVTAIRIFTWHNETRLTFALPGSPLTFAYARADAYPALGYDYSPVYANVTLGNQEGSAPLWIEAHGGPRGKHSLWEIDFRGQAFATPAESSGTEIVIRGVGLEWYE